MSIQILHRVLSTDKLAALRHALAQLNFVSGLGTNPTAQDIKHNLQAQPSEATRALATEVQQALYKHTHFGSLVLPKRSSEPLFAKYTPGMYYHNHIDEPLMRGQLTLRTDLSCTLFISDKEDYEGGELVIGEGAGSKTVKLTAGDAVIYPSSSVHQITQVSAGERMVALCWFESLIRDQEKRQIVYEMDTALAAVLNIATAESEPAKKIAQTRANLIRMWADS